MLQQLTVNNFAIIDNILIEFENHLNVLTGETGAGKSLIIDAIGLLLGDRSSSQMIRTGEEKASVEGVFIDYNEEIDQLLAEFGIDQMDYLVIRRDILKNGKSISRINGYIVTLNQLLAISNLLADIHTQQDTKKLFDTHNYVDFIDTDDILKKIHQYQEMRKVYLQNLKEYQKLVDDFSKSQENLDFYQYRLHELQSLNLDLDEIAKLEEELVILNNFDTINHQYSEINDLFNNGDLLNNLYNIKQGLIKLSNVSPEYQNMAEIVDSCYYDLEDIAQTINNNLSHLEFDSKRLDYINDRLNSIREIERKYRMDVTGLIAYQEELAAMISNVDQSDFLINQAKDKVLTSFNDLVAISQEISAMRKLSSEKLLNNINKTLKDLCLDKVRLQIIVSEANISDPFVSTCFKDKGINEVEFLISFNVGEELRPLAKVASGGEMSRIMLALKTHLLENMKLSTVIFDEIDSGISGEVALAVANKIKEISKQTQVLAITHLGIVAAAADQHLFVSKAIKNDKTYTLVEKLNQDERIAKIAEMVSSTNNDLTSLLVAEGMINKFK